MSRKSPPLVIALMILVVGGAGLALLLASRGPLAFEASRQGAADCGEERLDSHFVSRGMDREARSCFYRASLAGIRSVFRSRRDDEVTYWIVTPAGTVDVWSQNTYVPWVHLEDCRLQGDPEAVFAFQGARINFIGGGEVGNNACRHEWAYEGFGPPTEVHWQTCWAGLLPSTCPVRVNGD